MKAHTRVQEEAGGTRMYGSPLSVPRAAAAYAALHATLFLAHWAYPIEPLLGLIPSSAFIGVLNPLLFLVVALCFWAASVRVSEQQEVRQRRLVRAASVGAALLILVAGAFVADSVTPLPLGLDAALRSTNQAPSFALRLSPNSSVAFLLTGIAFLAFVRPLVGYRRAVYLVCTVAVAAIGLAGVVGQLLGLEMLYRLGTFNRILPPTAFAFTVVGAGLWGLQEAVHEVPLQEIEGRIARRTLTVLALVALGCGVAGFAVMRETFEASVARNLVLAANTTAASLLHTIKTGLLLPRTISTRPAVVQALEKLAVDESDESARGVLQRVAQNIGTELARVEVFAASGTLVAQAGTSVREEFIVKHPLGGSVQGTTLGWNQGYVLVTQHEVQQDGRSIGRVVAEQRLPLFDGLLTDVRASSETADAAVCSIDGNRAACAPTRVRREAFTIPLLDAQGLPAFPVVRALRGQSGVLIAKDPRGVDVVSAYTPLEDLGLGLAVKTDVATLYAPLRARLGLLTLAVLGIVLLAIYALRSQVRPVVGRLAESERSLKAMLEEQSELVSLAKPNGLAVAYRGVRNRPESVATRADVRQELK